MGFFDGDDQKSLKSQLKLCPPKCHTCQIHKQCKSPCMKAQGKGNSAILIVVDCPTQTDDIRGKWLSDDYGKVFRSLFPFNLEDECWIMGAIQCHKESKGSYNKPKITNIEIECCRPSLFRNISILKPKIIILLGESSIKSYLQHRWHKNLDADDHTGCKKSSWESIVKRWRGLLIPDQEYNCWVMCSFSILDLISDYDTIVPLLVCQDMELALSKLNTQIPKYNFESKIHLPIQSEAIKLLIDMKQKSEKPWMVFDYETSGLKPYHEDHFIYSASVYDPNKDIGFAFLMNSEIEPYFCALLENPKIHKIAHNMKFEDTWSNIKLNTEVRPWSIDTMIWMHTEDNRVGYVGLKYQAYVKYGVIDYSSEVEPYLRQIKGSIINNIRNAPVKKLLTYNALDSIITNQLATDSLSHLQIVR